MSPISVEQRQRIHAEQKRKQGLSLGPNLATYLPADDGGSTPVVVSTKTRPPPSMQLPPTKKAKHASIVNLEVGLSGERGPSGDASWMSRLTCQRSFDGNDDEPVRTAWDTRYPFNRVMNEALGAADPEKVAAMGLGQTLVAVKTYSLWASLLAHMAEGAVGKVVGVHNQLEARLKASKDSLKLCQGERDLLKQDLHKWDSENTRLERKVLSLEEAKKGLSESLKAAEARLKIWTKRLTS